MLQDYSGGPMQAETKALESLFQKLWKDYSTINPQAEAIHRLLGERGEKVINDHVAFRTYNDPRISISVLAKFFLDLGYREKDHYEFKEKKLFAKYYQHPHEELPKVFISELLLEQCSPKLQTSVRHLIDQIPADSIRSSDFLVAGPLWKISSSVYEELLSESEYAGWLAAFGFRANHFTVSFNHLKTFKTLQELNQFLKSQGFPLNQSGGELKGTPEEYLEQSSTLAAQVEWSFSDRKMKIPACYYEFARRYPTATGQLYHGFIAASADKIFESTDRKAQ